jgi:D-glycero-D-manno-heptose 1,7-bisphosphate phosphatase
MQLVILNRDGVINEEMEPGVHSPADWQPIRGSLEAIARLSHAGWKVAIAMNMPLTSGTDIDTQIRINSVMQRRVRESGGFIEGVFFCPHLPAVHCSCRKPQPGLLHDIASRFRVRLSQIPFIGDTLTDMQVARAAGARPILVKTGKGFGTVGMPGFEPDIPVFDDLYGAVEALLSGFSS